MRNSVCNLISLCVDDLSGLPVALHVQDQDTWWLSGIFRDVVLYKLPGPVAIEDFHIEAEVEPPY
eukprot:845814-Amphidinium_carterae.2